MERGLRLRRAWEVRRARGRGRAFADGPLVARVLANGLAPPANRYTVVAGKKVGGAVQRNRLKRLVREALRHLHPTLAPGHDLVVIVRGGADEMPDYAAARASMDRIVRRAGLTTPPASTPEPPTPDDPVIPTRPRHPDEGGISPRRRLRGEIPRSSG